jgi:hypothetical protein
MRNHLGSRVALLVAAFSMLTTAVIAGPAGRREVTLPAGTLLPLTLDSYVASDSSRIESPVHAHLRRALIVDGVTVLPAGTPISGYVTDATRSGRVKGRAHVAFRFTTLSADGERYRVETSRVVRQAPATKRQDTAKIAVPAGAGALIGALTNGKKGAAVGTAIGGGAGTGVVLATRGKEVRLGKGAPVAVRLLRPLRVSI